VGRQTSLEVKYSVEKAAEAKASVRLDPYALPQRFRYDTGLSGEASEAAVVLDRGLATISRRLPSGIPMAMRMPMDIFEGVAVRMVPASDGSEDVTIVVELLHRDPMLSLPLMVTTEMDDVIADWRAWGRILGVPLLLVDADGSYRPVETRIGCVTVQPMKPRRKRSVLAKRRPRFLARRRTGDATRSVMIAPSREITSWE
jgi:hypothetical protein